MLNQSNSKFPFLSFDKHIGYDTANKRMLLRIAESLWNVVGQKEPKFYHPIIPINTYYCPKWTHVIREMFLMEGRNPDSVRVTGYYSTIRRILKDIKVIRYDAKGGLIPGSNWDRFFDENNSWNWFRTDTTCGGRGKIVSIV